MARHAHTDGEAPAWDPKSKKQGDLITHREVGAGEWIKLVSAARLTTAQEDAARDKFIESQREQRESSEAATRGLERKLNELDKRMHAMGRQLEASSVASVEVSAGVDKILHALKGIGALNLLQRAPNLHSHEHGDE